MSTRSTTRGQSFLYPPTYSTTQIDQKLNDLAVWVAGRFSVAIYGTMTHSTPQVGPDLGAGWVPVTYGILDFAPRGLTMDPATGIFTFEHVGIYQLSSEITLSHDEVNAGRQFLSRVYNVTEGTSTEPVPTFTGRNQGGTNFTVSFMLEIDATGIGDQFRAELGGGDTYSSVVWEFTTLSINMESEWLGPIPTL